ncbi:MAG: hypothetical protein GF308_10100 [Candidatus Heimdallarchaeota archaeon]|nr:hypothetical protein [Candidatus Heimdallarchaeota archaeon]
MPIKNIQINKVDAKGISPACTFPDNLTTKIKQEIALKSMPLGAKVGDFTTVIIDDMIFVNYVLNVVIPNNRDTLYSISVCIDEHENPLRIKTVLETIVSELKACNAVTPKVLDTFAKKLYQAFQGTTTEIKITKNIIISIKSFNAEEEEEEEEKKSDIESRFEEELW